MESLCLLEPADSLSSNLCSLRHSTSYLPSRSALRLSASNGGPMTESMNASSLTEYPPKRCRSAPSCGYGNHWGSKPAAYVLGADGKSKDAVLPPDSAGTVTGSGVFKLTAEGSTSDAASSRVMARLPSPPPFRPTSGCRSPIWECGAFRSPSKITS